VSIDASVHQEIHQHTYAAPEPVAGPVRFGLPRVVAHFTGRDTELARLEEALSERHQAVITQTVTGLGGVGKTQLAAAYARRHADDYEVVAWIRAEDGGIADLATLADDLNLSVEGLTPEEQAQRVLRWLASTERSWLLVLDNVADPRQLASWSPSSGPGRVLVTSRRRDFDQFGPMIDVRVFDKPTAVRYLVERTGRIGERTSAGQLAQALGYLPLALSHAAAYCKVRTGFDGYLDLLAGLPAAKLYDTNREAFYDQTVATTWKVSVNAAQADASLAGAVLAMAAYLAPDAIPRSLFYALVSGERPREGGRVDAALDALHRYSLAEVTDTSVGVHRLLQKVIRDDAQSRGDTTGGEAAFQALADAFPLDNDPRGMELLPQVTSLSGAIQSWKDTEEGLLALVNRASWYLLHASRGEQWAITFLKTSVSSYTSDRGADDPTTLVVRGNLAEGLALAGQFEEAITQYQALLEDCLRVVGPDDPHTLTTRHNLARWLGKVGQVEEAITQYQALLEDRLRVQGPDHPGTLITRNNLAGWLGEVGQVEEAVTQFLVLLEDRLRVQGPGHPGTLMTRNNLAYWLDKANQSRLRGPVT
jgi:tetratricopeptide (TPR) repeat protein